MSSGSGGMLPPGRWMPLRISVPSIAATWSWLDIARSWARRLRRGCGRSVAPRAALAGVRRGTEAIGARYYRYVWGGVERYYNMLNNGGVLEKWATRPPHPRILTPA